MSKKRSTRNTNKSLKALKRKQYARGGKSAVQSQRELLGQQQKKTLATPVQPKTGPKPKKSTPDSLFSDPARVSGGRMDNPRDIKLPEPSRSLGGGRGQPIRNDATINQVQTSAPPPVQQQTMDENTRRRVESGMGGNLGNQQAQSQSLVGGFTNDTGPSGGPKDRATLIGLDGREYSSNAALEAANARYLAAEAAKDATTQVTTQGITPEAPTGIVQEAPKADLRQMESESIFKAVPESEQWADKYVEQYPEWSETQKAEARAWAIKAKESKDGTAQMPSWLMDSDFLKGFEAANNMKYDTSKTVAPEGTVTGADDIKQLGDATDATSDTVTARELSTSQGDVKVADEGPRTRDAERYTAEKVGTLDPTKAAEGKVSKTGVAGQATATEAKETRRDTAAEEAAKGKFVDRPEYEDYATAARDDSDYGFDPSTVDEPKVSIRDGVTIPQSKIDEIKLDAEKRGLDPTDALKAYSDAMVERKVQTARAAEGDAAELGTAPTEIAAQADFLGAADVAAGRKEQITDAGEAGFAIREGRIAKDVGVVPAAQTGVVDGIGVADRNFKTGEVLTEAEKVETNLDAMPAYAKAAERVAQVGEAATRIANELGDAPSVDLEGREAILGEKPQGNAAQIGGIPTMAAATMQAVTGQDRNVAAADMMEVVANIPENITAAVSQDPASVEAQLDSGADPSVTAAVAALPQEALVSTQMEGLLAGMEDGETPAWARPAVAAIEAQMARRGLSASSVGRDALFNAIIQSALPMAQSNAQALQQRAQQNLSNEQQANLASAQNTMQVRMQNLANRQTAASQTADMAQQIAVQQGTFEQQAVMTSAQQQQESRMATTQMAQQRAQQVSAQNQQAAIAQLSTNAQMDLANLQALNAAGTQNLNAEQQSRLQTYNAQVSRTMRKADLQQDMEKANLSTNLQVELANLAEKNTASRESMSVENQERLTKLNTLVDFKKTNATLAQQMDMANMSNEQQINMAELAERAATDAANFTEDNRFELQRLQTYAQFMSQNTELAQQTELANFTASEEKLILLILWQKTKRLLKT